MGRFSSQMKGRAWVATVQVANMEQLGLTKEQYEKPEVLADFLTTLWNDSGKNRTSGIAVCVSEKGLYHAHMALYGNTTTLLNVSKILGNAHIEPQLGGKKELKKYLLKEAEYEEKGEQVLYTKDLDEIQDNKGSRNDLEDISKYLDEGLNPNQIMSINFAYRKFEKLIKSEYIQRRIQNTPLIKKTFNEWHFGSAGSGKTHYYIKLCEKFSPEQIYICNDFESGGFDMYLDGGAPPILFIDEFKGNMKFSQLLTTLDKYSRTQTHCRYSNTYNLWTCTVITSVYPPEQAYNLMVDLANAQIDKLQQLMRRLDLIVYHYKIGKNYYTYSIPASEYTNYQDLIDKVEVYKAFGDKPPLNLTKQLINLSQNKHKELMLKRSCLL